MRLKDFIELIGVLAIVFLIVGIGVIPLVYLWQAVGIMTCH